MCERKSPLVRWCRLIPRPSDLVFALVLLFVLIGGRHALFNDPGTPWHLRLGRDILATGAVPRCDTLTFTRARVPGSTSRGGSTLSWPWSSITRDGRRPSA